MNNDWIHQAVFYHIYPIGFCGAPTQNNETEPHYRLNKLMDWIPHLKRLHINAVYLGPVFDSSEHGYDTKDYYQIDTRLGDVESFAEICRQLHQNGIKIVLDGVFNHVGREFWAFKDVQKNGQSSRYCSWFNNLNFGGSSPMGDPFWYDAWEGHYNLVKLNLRNPEVVDHLLGAVTMWMDHFDIDGLRLDAADCVDMDFFRKLHQMVKQRRPDFWLMGEIIHGDYNRWANPDALDSTTNYECYKGIWSSHNDKNYFEIAHSLNRQFGQGGIYRSIYTYNFVDNHDVNRLASTLRNPAHAQNVYTLLFTMPGAPSVYYGSEWGLKGTKHDGSDADLRPCLDIHAIPNPDDVLCAHISRLAAIRRALPAICWGGFENVVIQNEQLVYKRMTDNQTVYVALNLADSASSLQFGTSAPVLTDLLTGTQVAANNGQAAVALPSCSGMVLVENDGSLDPAALLSPLDEQSIDTPSAAGTPAPAPLPPQPRTPGVYRSMDGGQVELAAIAKHTGTGEQLAVYRAADGSWHACPADEFFGVTQKDGREVYRFTAV